MDRVGSSIPFNASMAAQAYGRPQGVRAPQPVERAQPVQPAERTEPLARIGQPAEARPGSDPSRLVAAQVDAIDLSRDVDSIGGVPSPAGGYALYRHPADRNQAATGVALGRSLDVQG